MRARRVGDAPDGDASRMVALAKAEIWGKEVKFRKPVVNEGEVSPWESWRGERSSVMGVSGFVSSHAA